MADSDWGYTERNGPLTWASKFPLAGGSKQSPVDIDTKIVKVFSECKPLLFKCSEKKALQLINSGCGWKMEVNGEESELSGGPLEGLYKLKQFHCHWGSKNEKGSEHTVDGKSYAGELHLVHWNYSKYPSFTTAANHPDGLAVLAIFLKVGEEHKELKKIVSLLPKILFKGDFIKFEDKLNLLSFLPKDKGYWTYQGSLTTPPCTENVTWIIFKEPVDVSEQQLMLFRNLRCCKKADEFSTSEELIVNNLRPPLPLGNRELREYGSF